MPEQVACNLCGAEDAALLYRMRDYRLRVDEAEWNLVRCRRCGLAYVNPRPTREEIGRYYPPRYFKGRERHGRRYEREARYVPGPPGRLLDVGTARGDFPALMRGRGWEVEGLEAFGDANPHGLTIHRLSFPEGADRLPAEAYDVVTAWAVFEHLHDPMRAFAECARLLRPGGMLVIAVPNVRSVRGRLGRHEDVPRHLYVFSPATLRAYGRAVGLELREVDHSTDLFGGGAREVLQLWLARVLGVSTSEFFDVTRLPRRERLRRRPVLVTVLTAVGLVERVLLPDALVRLLRLSAHVVASFDKNPAGG